MAAALRLFRLGHQSLWIDEIFTWRSAGIGQPWAPARFLEDVHGPLYSLGLYLWSLVAGDSEWALRLPSALVGVALVAAVARLSARWLGEETAAPAAWLAAGSPFLVWYAPMLPHDPHTAPDRILNKYKAVAPSEHVAKYWANVEWFDETCGQLLDHRGVAHRGTPPKRAAREQPFERVRPEGESRVGVEGSGGDEVAREHRQQLSQLAVGEAELAVDGDLAEQADFGDLVQCVVNGRERHRHLGLGRFFVEHFGRDVPVALAEEEPAERDALARRAKPRAAQAVAQIQSRVGRTAFAFRAVSRPNSPMNQRSRLSIQARCLGSTGQVGLPRNQLNMALSGGNFHGQPVSIAMDYLALALVDLGNMSERRVNRLINEKVNDGLLPPFVNQIHPKFRTPWITSIVTGVGVAIFSALLTVREAGSLVSIGTLLAFVIVSAGILVLRVREPNLPRAFKTPWVWFVAPMGAVSAIYLMVSLPWRTWERLLIWLAIGLVIYFSYGMWRSKLAQAPTGN